MAAVAAALAFAPPVRAQAPPPQGALTVTDGAVIPLSLEDAQARALSASHRLAEARARQQGADAIVRGREAAQRPIVTASGGYTRTNHVTEFVVPTPTGTRVLYPDVPDNWRSRLDMQWPIYTGGRADALERAARAEAGAIAAEITAAQADLRLEVARAFWAVVTGTATVRVLEEGLTRAQAHVRDVRERFSAGLIPPNEVASAEAQESRGRMLLIEAQTQRDVVSAELARLIGVDGGRVEPRATLEAARQDESTVEAAIAQARGARAERVALQRRIDAAVQQQGAAKAGRLPSIAVVAGIDYARPNPRIFPRADRWDESWDLGVNVSWPLWDGGRTDADVAQTAGAAEAARRRLAEFDSVLAVEVRQRALEIASGTAAVAAADDAVRAATEAERVVGERFRAGVIPPIDVLDAQFALLQAQLERTRALANLRLAEARLSRAVGL
jgi:outer membrane protein TolC